MRFHIRPRIETSQLNRSLVPAKNEIIVSSLVVLLLGSLTFYIFVNRNSNDTKSPDPKNNVSVETTPEIVDGEQGDATLGSTINWTKQVQAQGVDQIEEGTIVEQISVDQDYVYDSLELPDGWIATWSFDPIGTPENQRTYREEPPVESLSEKPTYIKISTGTKDTFKPSVIAPIAKPLDEITRDTGKNPSAPTLYKKKMYMIMRGVKASTDPGNANTTLYTVDCFDTVTYARCSGYPGYFSSSAGPITGNDESLGITSGTKDINTAQSFESFLDDGTYGNEGRLYFPAQKANDYGVACINILTAKNCGFTSLGSSAQVPYGPSPYPTLIQGFVEKDGKLYGHVNDMDLARQKVVCFNLNSDGNGEDAPCTGYSDSTLSRAPTYSLNLHSGVYRANGDHVISGDNMYWTVDYKYGSTNIFDAQTNLNSLMFCFNVITRAVCPGTGNNEGWSHGLGGAPVPDINIISDETTNIFVWKKPGNVEHAICTTTSYIAGLSLNTSPRCFNLQTGIFITGGNDAGFPGFMYPEVMWPGFVEFVPWKVGVNQLDTVNAQGQAVTYFPLYSTRTTNVDSPIENGATLCYNWETQRPCEGFGYGVRYWFEINQGMSGDVGYAFDGACMWAVGDANFLWSFDPIKGEFPCRSSQTELTIASGDNQYYCDGEQRAFNWDKVRLAKTNLYNFHTLKVTVRNAETDVILKDDVDIKQAGVLDISDISYQQNQRLKLEVIPTVYNTSPWANGQIPRVSAVLNSENVQYCFETRPKQHCDLQQLASIAGSSVITDSNTITSSSTETVNVRIPNSEQCYKDVRVSVSANKSQIREGDDVIYTVRIEHKGKLSLPNAATRGRITGARVEATIPNAMEFVSANGGGVRSGNRVVWSAQEFGPEDITQRQLTLRPKTATSQAQPANVVYAATTQQPVTVTAAVISGDDIFQSDNSASNNSVILLTEVPDTGGGGETENPPVEEEPPATEEPEVPNEEAPGTPANLRLDPSDEDSSGGTSGPDQALTPGFISSILPPALRNQTESLFKFVNSAVTPIPNPVAVALPYGTIAFLIAFASIYVYQAAQEGNNRKILLGSYKRFKRTEELRKNYVDLTSHYLNTPIATMQSSIELMETNEEVPTAISDAAKLRLNRVVQHVKLLLGKADELSRSAEATAGVMEPIAKRKSLLSAGIVVPVVVILLITAIINAVFVWADKYSASIVTVAIQSVYFILSFIAMILAFNAYRNQKYATSVAEHELGLEKKLTAVQTAFIANTSKTIEGDLVELEQMSPTIASARRGDIFVKGLQSLKKATSKLDYLNKLTNHSVVPTLPNQTIKTLTDDIVQSLQGYADEKKVTLEIRIEPGLTALVDEDGLRQILYSTLHNGIKFNRPGGRLTLAISRQSSSSIKILVKDNGQGIAKEKIDQIFTPFGRGTDSKEYNFEGFGLDLYMNKLIAEQCGGTITLQSTKDVGTTLTVVLPA